MSVLIQLESDEQVSTEKDDFWNAGDIAENGDGVYVYSVLSHNVKASTVLSELSVRTLNMKGRPGAVDAFIRVIIPMMDIFNTLGGVRPLPVASSDFALVFPGDAIHSNEMFLLFILLSTSSLRRIVAALGLADFLGLDPTIESWLVAYTKTLLYRRDLREVLRICQPVVGPAKVEGVMRGYVKHGDEARVRPFEEDTVGKVRTKIPHNVSPIGIRIMLMNSKYHVFMDVPTAGQPFHYELDNLEAIKSCFKRLEHWYDSVPPGDEFRWPRKPVLDGKWFVEILYCSIHEPSILDFIHPTSLYQVTFTLDYGRGTPRVPNASVLPIWQKFLWASRVAILQISHGGMPALIVSKLVEACPCLETLSSETSDVVGECDIKLYRNPLLRQVNRIDISAENRAILAAGYSSSIALFCCVFSIPDRRNPSFGQSTVNLLHNRN
jgi:hypothetical protein